MISSFIYIYIIVAITHSFTLYYKKYITIINSETLIKIHFFDLLIVTHCYCKSQKHFFSQLFISYQRLNSFFLRI